jgi:hypothetical protein
LNILKNEKELFLMNHDPSSEADKVITPGTVSASPISKDTPTLEPSPNATYPEGTDQAWGNFIKSVSKFIWVGVVLIIVFQLLGNSVVSNIKHSDSSNRKMVAVTIPGEQQSQITSEIASVLSNALVVARTSASNSLDQWKDEAMERVDNQFLDWYYNYFTQLGIGAKGIWLKLTISSEEEQARGLIEGFQREFTKQVLQPPLMQLQMERFTRTAIDDYVSEANHGLAGIQGKYEIPQPTWENFLQGLSGTVYNTGGKQKDIALRALSRGTGFAVTTGMMKAIGAVGTKKVLTATASKTATKAVTKLATKTATKALTEGTGHLAGGILGLELLNPIAGLGVLAWDIWDHYHTVGVERPIMYTNLEKYMSEVEDSLLNDKENGVLSSINKFHDGIIDDLNHRPSLTT